MPSSEFIFHAFTAKKIKIFSSMSMISFYFCHKNCTNFFLDFSHYFIIDSTSSWELTLIFFLIFCLLSFVPEILPKTLSWHSAQTRYLVDNWCERKNISVLSQSLFFLYDLNMKNAFITKYYTSISKFYLWWFQIYCMFWNYWAISRWRH